MLRILHRTLIVFTGALAWTACSRDRTGAPSAPREAAAGLERLAGAPVRLVWLEDRRLMLFDSRRPSPPVVLREAEGLSRPLFTRDGQSVLFNEAGKIRSLNLQSMQAGALRQGFVVAVGRDSASDANWVYAADGPAGEALFRFPLEAPERRETFWDKAPVDPRWVQISQDGSRLAAVFFGKDVSLADVQAGQWRKLISQDNVCLAPDNSYLSACLDGTRRRLRFFLPNGDPRDPAAHSDGPVSWRLELPNLPALAGRDATTVRWSNHPRFLAIGAAGTQSRGRIGLARLSADLRSFEDGVFLEIESSQISDADAWIGGPQAVALADFPQSAPMEAPVIQGPNQRWLRWPRSYDGVHFLWTDDFSINQLPERREPCRVQARGYGRFDEWGSMRLDGGTFEADLESARAFAAAAADKNEFTLELVLSESIEQRTPFSTRLVALELDNKRDAFSLSRVDQSLVLRVLLEAGDGSPPREYQTVLRPIAVTTNKPFHLIVTVKGGEAEWNYDGESFGSETALGPPSMSAWRAPVSRLVFGDAEQQGNAGWRGRLDHVLLRCGPVDWTETRDNTSNALRFAPDRQLVRVQRIKAKLSQASSVELPAEARRALVVQTYDVVEVVSGKFDSSRLAVAHWAVLDGRPVPSRPMKPGEIFELQLVAADRHPQVESERIYLSEHDFQLPLYFDVAPLHAPPLAAHEKK